MMSSSHHLHPPRALAACCLLALTACANQPLQNQLATSREAVEQAKTAGAPATDPANFNTASEKLRRANLAAEDRKDDMAMRLAQQAQADADLAHARTGATHAATAASELAKSNRALHDEISGVQQSK